MFASERPSFLIIIEVFTEVKPVRILKLAWNETKVILLTGEKVALLADNSREAV